MYLIALEMYVCVLNIYEFKSSNLFICVRPGVDDLLTKTVVEEKMVIHFKYMFLALLQ